MRHLLRTLFAVLSMAAWCGAQTTQPTVSSLLSQIQAAETADIAAAVAAAKSADAATIQQLQGQVQAAAAAASQGGRPRHFGVNLEGLSGYGDSRGLIFADAMLQAQPFYNGHDAAGNPTADQQTIVLGNALPSEAGTYKFVCTGQAKLTAVLSYAMVANQSYNATSNTTTADVVITAQGLGAIPQMCLQIGNVVAGHVSNVQLWRPGVPTDGSQRFNPPFIKLLQPFDCMRFMDTLATNGSTQINWSDRPQPTDRNFTTKGIDFEDCLDLGRATGKAVWLCIPCQANADYLAHLMSLIHQRAAGIVYVEWSNEIWNSRFPQWQQSMTAAKADAQGGLAYDGTGDPNILQYRWMGERAAAIGQAACNEWGVSNVRQTPVRPVLAVQWGNPQVGQYALAYVAGRIGHPSQYIYALAIAPYAVSSIAMLGRFNANDPTVTGPQIVADLAAGGINNAAANDPGTSAFLAQARQYNLHPRAYEFGFDTGQAQFCLTQKTAAAHDPNIGPVVTSYVNNAWAAGFEGLNWYTLTAADTTSGQWGLTADTYDLAAPKYQAAAQAAQTTVATH